MDNRYLIKQIFPITDKPQDIIIPGSDGVRRALSVAWEMDKLLEMEHRKIDPFADIYLHDCSATSKHTHMMGWMQSRLITNIRDSRFLYMAYDTETGEYVGMCICAVIPYMPEVRIIGMYVLPEHRERDIFKSFHQQAIQLAKKHHRPKVALDVGMNNIVDGLPVSTIYSKRGFHRTHVTYGMELISRYPNLDTTVKHLSYINNTLHGFLFYKDFQMCKFQLSCPLGFPRLGNLSLLEHALPLDMPINKDKLISITHGIQQALLSACKYNEAMSAIRIILAKVSLDDESVSSYVNTWCGGSPSVLSMEHIYQ